MLEAATIVTWPVPTQIILFSEMFFSEFFLKENKKSDGIFGNILFVKIEYWKLISFSTSMCQSDHSTTVSMNNYDTDEKVLL